MLADPPSRPLPADPPSRPLPADPPSRPLLGIVRAGPLTTVQDLGRPGYAHLGVPPSGAAHAGALAYANRQVGNEEAAAGLETTLLGVTLRLSVARRVAVTGAQAPLTLDGEPVELPAEVPAGGTLRVGTARVGLRSYIAVAGGIAVPPVLGSRSSDRLSGLGPAPLRDGDELPLGPDVPVPGQARAGDRPAGPTLAERLADGRLRLRPGPRADWLTAAALRTLGSAGFAVSRDSDRVGLRLDGPRLDWARTGELPSEGLLTGALQVPPDGRPVLFLTDHPVTGGYPVVGVVDPTDLPVAAQARPGTVLRFAVE